MKIIEALKEGINTFLKDQELKGKQVEALNGLEERQENIIKQMMEFNKIVQEQKNGKSNN